VEIVNDACMYSYILFALGAIKDFPVSSIKSSPESEAIFMLTAPKTIERDWN
jgi:hypothetical protein